MKVLSVLSLLVLANFLSFGQVTNTICNNAISLVESVDGNCNNQLSGSAQNSIIDDVVVVYTDDTTIIDAPVVWYKFQPDSTSNYIIELSSDAFFNNWRIATGDCDTLYHERDALINIGNELSKDTLYYIYGFSISYDLEVSTEQFDLCIYSLNVEPATNLDCAEADTLRESNETCNFQLTGNTIGATYIDTLGCDYEVGMSSASVWYYYKANHDTSVYLLHEVPDLSYSSSLNVYSNNCDSLVNIACSPFSFGFTTQKDSVYYISVESNASLNEQAARFDLCVSPCVPPLNDEWENAVTLTKSESSSCQNSVSGTSKCTIRERSDYYSNFGVWYKYTPVDSGNYVFSISDDTESLYSLIYIFNDLETSSIASPTCLNVSFSDNLLETYLAKDSTYYISVDIFNSEDNSKDFNICVTEKEPCIEVIENDSCINALTLELGTGGCSSANAQTINCSSSGCDTKYVWFRSTVPSSGKVTIETSYNSTANFDTYMTVYSGDCNSTTRIASDDDSGNEFYSLLELTNLTPDSTIFIEVYELGGNAGSFSICAWDPSTENCPETITLLKSIDNTVNYNAANSINSSQMILNPSQVSYYAGENIVLNQSFEVESGAAFSAQIEDCMIPSERDSKRDHNKKNSKKDDQIINIKEFIKHYLK